MLENFSVRNFKSLEDVTVDLGLVNVFIGANGSGKSNLLEAVGVLSAAASGRVDDQTLLSRGVRPGVPRLYRSAFAARPGTTTPSHICFGGRGARAKYEVSLHNPLQHPTPAWRFETELWADREHRLVERLSGPPSKSNPDRGVAALKAVDVTGGDALDLLELLQDYVVYTPTTPVLRGASPETQPRDPLGLSGGNLARAISELLSQSERDERSNRICREALGLVDWASNFGASTAAEVALSPAASASEKVIMFRDRFMREGRNVLSGYDASEGALYALLLAVIAGHRNGPRLCAVDNADHGLNPRLSRSLFEHLCEWYLGAHDPRQILLTTHNPLVLDGLPLHEDGIRLFTVSRTNSGRTAIRRVQVDDNLRDKAEQGWSLSRLWVMGHLGGVPDV